MTEEMRNLRWWKVGLVRIIAISVIGGGVHGLTANIQRHSLFNMDTFSGPTSILALLIGIALFILGFRTERGHAEISRIPDA